MWSSNSLVALLAIVGFARAALGLDLSKLCLDPPAIKKNELVVFTSPAQVLNAVRQFEEGKLADSCRDHGEVFERLKWLLDERQVLNDICGPEAYERIRAFHQTFIHFYVPEMTRDQLVDAAEHPQQKLKAIPKALRNFFIAFATQVDAACKQQLVARIEALQSDKRLVDEEDFAVIGQYKRESHRMGFLYQLTKADASAHGWRRESDFNKLEMVDMLKARALEQGLVQLRADGSQQMEADDGSVLYVQVRFDDRLRRIKEACLKRFMPVYQELFAPVIKLNSLGYVDRLNTKLEDKALKERDTITRWFDIIQACEVLKDIEILHNPTAMQALVGLIEESSHLIDLSRRANKSQVSGLGKDVKILSREQARELERQSQNSPEGIVRPLYDPEQAIVAHQPVKFTPRLWITDADKVATQADQFDSDVKRRVTKRVSLFLALTRDLSFQLKNTFFNGLSQIRSQDELAMLGRLAAFVKRHQNVIRGISICFLIIFITSSLVG